MPFKSLKQAKYLYLNKPKVFEQFSVNYGIPLKFRKEFNQWRKGKIKGSKK